MKTGKKTARTLRAPAVNPKIKWSGRVTTHSHALMVPQGAFTRSPNSIATSLKRSTEHSRHRKSGAFRSAMSMLNFYINRAGKNLTHSQRRKLEAAKVALHKRFHRKQP